MDMERTHHENGMDTDLLIKSTYQIPMSPYAAYFGVSRQDNFILFIKSIDIFNVLYNDHGLLYFSLLSLVFMLIWMPTEPIVDAQISTLIGTCFLALL